MTDTLERTPVLDEAIRRIEADAPELPGAEVAGSGMDHETWLDGRRLGVGSADIAAIVGVEGAFGTETTVWHEKVMGYSKPDTKAMSAGRRFEQVIADWFTEDEGIVTAQPPLYTTYRSKTFPLAQASPDRLVLGPDGEVVAGLEVKNAGGYKAADWKEGPPPAYVIQCRWQRMIYDLPMIWLTVCLGGNTRRDFQILPTYEHEAALRKYAEDFWAFVESETPPDPDSSEATRRALLAQFPAPVPKSQVEGGDELEEALLLYRDAKDRGKEAESDVTLAKNRILAILGNNEVGLIGGQPAVRYPVQSKQGYWVKPQENRVIYPLGPYRGR